MGVLVPILAVALTGVALLLCFVTAVSALRFRSRKMGFATLAFGAFAVRGALMIADGQGWLDGPFEASAWVVGADAATLALLFFAISSRG